jgi:hypothetical protein
MEALLGINRELSLHNELPANDTCQGQIAQIQF